MPFSFLYAVGKDSRHFRGHPPERTGPVRARRAKLVPVLAARNNGVFRRHAHMGIELLKVRAVHGLLLS